jgi:hypothetical protein
MRVHSEEMNEINRLRRMDDGWKPMAGLEPHEAALEQLMNDDLDDGMRISGICNGEY